MYIWFIISRYENLSRLKIFIFILIIDLDSIRELRKYSIVDAKDLTTPHGEAHAHMKQFRSQRNFYIAGFALFLWL